MVSEKRLSLTSNDNIRYQLKPPYRDGTTHVIFEHLDSIARLAALVPKPRVNLTHFHGVFVPNSKHPALVTPAKRCKGNRVKVSEEPRTPAECRASMTWVQGKKGVFNKKPEPSVLAPWPDTRVPPAGGPVRLTRQ